MPSVSFRHATLSTGLRVALHPLNIATAFVQRLQRPRMVCSMPRGKRAKRLCKTIKIRKQILSGVGSVSGYFQFFRSNDAFRIRLSCNAFHRFESGPAYPNN